MENNLLPMPWDSDFFGFKIGKIDKFNLSDLVFESNLNVARNLNYDLIYVFDYVNKEIESNVIESFNLSLVDTKILFGRILDKEESVPYIESASKVNTADLADLYNLALESGQYSRYKTDSMLNSKFEKFYKTWVDNSLSGTLADDVFLYKINSKIVGFVTLKYQNESCNIGLIAVNRDFRGNRIGEKLMQKCFFEGRKKGCNIITVATQYENSGACRFYERLGLKIKESNKIYHSWINK